MRNTTDEMKRHFVKSIAWADLAAELDAFDEQREDWTFTAYVPSPTGAENGWLVMTRTTPQAQVSTGTCDEQADDKEVRR